MLLSSSRSILFGNLSKMSTKINLPSSLTHSSKITSIRSISNSNSNNSKSNPFQPFKEWKFPESIDKLLDSKKGHSVLASNPRIKEGLELLKKESEWFINGTRKFWYNVQQRKALIELENNQNKELNRREKRLCHQTQEDIWRLGPFLIYNLLPGAGILLPVVIHVFPRLLPSTFEREGSRLRNFTARSQHILEHKSSFQVALMERLLSEERSLRSISSPSDLEIRRTKVETVQFINRICQSPSTIELDQLIDFAKAHPKLMETYSLSDLELSSLCSFIGIRVSLFSFRDQTEALIKTELAYIQQDNDLIRKEGISSLTDHELQDAVNERFISVLDSNTGQLLPRSSLEQRLNDHLDLSNKAPTLNWLAVIRLLSRF